MKFKDCPWRMQTADVQAMPLSQLPIESREENWPPGNSNQTLQLEPSEQEYIPLEMQMPLSQPPIAALEECWVPDWGPPQEQEAQLEMQTDEVHVMPLSQPLAPQTPDLSMQEQADPPPPGVFWSVPSSAESGSTDKEIQDKCIAVGIQVPNFKRMEPWARHRLPPNPDRDSYKRLAQRISDKDWHINHGPPKESPELAEDAHFMMRVLHRRLPLDRITKPTKASKSECQFARNYGVKFATFARERNATHFVDGIVIS